MDGVEVTFHAFVTSPLDVGEWSTSPPRHSTPGERTLPPNGKEVGWSTKHICKFWTQGDCSLNKQVQDDRTVYLHEFQFSIRTVIAVFNSLWYRTALVAPTLLLPPAYKGDILDMFIIDKVWCITLTIPLP